MNILIYLLLVLCVFVIVIQRIMIAAQDAEISEKVDIINTLKRGPSRGL